MHSTDCVLYLGLPFHSEVGVCKEAVGSPCCVKCLLKFQLDCTSWLDASLQKNAGMKNLIVDVIMATAVSQLLRSKLSY